MCQFAFAHTLFLSDVLLPIHVMTLYFFRLIQFYETFLFLFFLFFSTFVVSNGCNIRHRRFVHVVCMPDETVSEFLISPDFFSLVTEKKGKKKE